MTADDTDKGIFTCIGKIGDSDQYAMAACLNGKTSAVGTLESRSGNSRISGFDRGLRHIVIQLCSRVF